MSGQERQDWLDELLEQPEPYIPDEGFTAGVLARLPAARPGWHRAAVHLGVALVAGLVFFVVGGGQVLGDSLMQLALLGSPEALPIWAALVLAAGAAWVPLTIALEDE